MGEQYDLARMMREISEETDTKTVKTRPLTQEEIKQLIAKSKKPAAVAPPDPGKSPK